MPIDAPTDSAVAEFAGQLFFRLWRASHTRTVQVLEPLGLTPPLFGLLNVLGARESDGGRALQQELGSIMGIDPSTMVSLIDKLEESGLAKRRPCPTDRRAREVMITPKGRRLLERGRSAALGVEDEVLRGLSADERRELRELLQRALGDAPPQPAWQAEEEH